MYIHITMLPENGEPAYRIYVLEEYPLLNMGTLQYRRHNKLN